VRKAVGKFFSGYAGCGGLGHECPG
jgi:hypothetical protein